MHSIFFPVSQLHSHTDGGKQAIKWHGQWQQHRYSMWEQPRIWLKGSSSKFQPMIKNNRKKAEIAKRKILTAFSLEASFRQGLLSAQILWGNAGMQTLFDFTSLLTSIWSFFQASGKCSSLYRHNKGSLAIKRDFNFSFFPKLMMNFSHF